MGESDRDRNDQGRYADGIAPETVLEVFDAREDRARPVTAGDVVDEQGIARRTAHNKLNALVERGELETRKIGARGRVWWVPLPADESTPERREKSVQDDAVATTTNSLEPAPGTETRRETDAGRAGEHGTDDDTARLVADVVDAVASSWDADDRVDDRKAAAEAILEYAVATGEHVGETTAVDEFRDEHPVAGQNPTTWWRQNAREVLSEVGEYSRGHGGYRVDRDDLVVFVETDE